MYVIVWHSRQYRREIQAAALVSILLQKCLRQPLIFWVVFWSTWFNRGCCTLILVQFRLSEALVQVCEKSRIHIPFVPSSNVDVLLLLDKSLLCQEVPHAFDKLTAPPILPLTAKKLPENSLFRGNIATYIRVAEAIPNEPC